jgi:hypothetical protein
LQKGTNKATLKQVGKNGILVVDKVTDMSTLFEFLLRMKTSMNRPDQATKKII